MAWGTGVLISISIIKQFIVIEWNKNEKSLYNVNKLQGQLTYSNTIYFICLQVIYFT